MTPLCAALVEALPQFSPAEIEAVLPRVLAESTASRPLPAIADAVRTALTSVARHPPRQECPAIDPCATEKCLRVMERVDTLLARNEANLQYDAMYYDRAEYMAHKYGDWGYLPEYNRYERK